MPTREANDRMWRAFLDGDLEGIAELKRILRRVPSAPRCKLCQAPFSGPGGAVLKITPFRRWRANSALCSICTGGLGDSVGGAEGEATFLFADIRGSTSVAEHMRPAEFQGILQRFYKVAAVAIDGSGGLVDKYLGDGVVGLFVPVFTGEVAPAAAAIRAGRAILDGVGPGNGGPTWLPVGVGVHSGLAYIGVLGTEGGQLDFTAVGDAVNTAARLGSVAGAGELLVSIDAATRANLAIESLERRTLELKGREELVDVVVLTETVSA